MRLHTALLRHLPAAAVSAVLLVGGCSVVNVAEDPIPPTTTGVGVGGGTPAGTHSGTSSGTDTGTSSGTNTGTGGLGGAGGMGGMGGLGGAGGAGGSGGSGCAPTGPSAPHYVDPNLGTDDTLHGSGPGACALATIDYALSVATDDIYLSADTFSVTNTIVFTGGQHLICDPLGGTTLNGQPSYATGHYTIVFTSSADNAAVSNCNIVAAGQSGYCIDSASASSVTLDNLTMTNCGGAAIRAGSDITVTNCDINHGSTNVFFQSPHDGHIANNEFSSTNNDVGCNTAGGSITGSGNTHPGPGVVTCSAECNCPINFGN